MRFRHSWFGLIMAGALAALLVGACGSGEARDNISVANSGPGVTATVPGFRPISSATPAPAAATTGASPVAAATGAAAGGGPTLNVVAKDNFFEQKDLTVAKSQSYTLVLKNEGSAIHNWHLIGVKDASGKEPTTDLIPGWQTTRISFAIAQPGTYTYRCDVHPGEMQGQLKVQ